MATSLRRGLVLLRAPANELAFALRSGMRWRRGRPEPSPRGGAGAVALSWLPAPLRGPAGERIADLVRRFGLQEFAAAVPPDVLARNVARIEALERLSRGLVLPCRERDPVHCVDVGAGDFHYATALQRWLSRHGVPPGRPVSLRGIELDGHGIYRDGHSRVDHAEAHAALAAQGQHGTVVRYEVADAGRTELGDPDVVTMFFPFLSAYACLQWGAPVSRLRPRRLLRRAVSALRPGGWLVVVNQTSAEHARLCRLLRELPVDRIARRSFATDLVPEASRTAGQVGSIWRVRQGVPPARSAR